MSLAYSQVGVKFDFLPVLDGAYVSFEGSMENNQLPTLPDSPAKMNFPPETKDLIDHGPPNDHDNTLMIYLVGRMGLGLNQHNGVASPAKYVETADRRFRNKVILSNSRPRDYTAAHEALHVLSDAAHGNPPYNDFDAEYTNENTIWTVPPTTPIDESERRDNSSIGSTKRISLAQEAAIHSSPLAK